MIKIVTALLRCVIHVTEYVVCIKALGGKLRWRCMWFFMDLLGGEIEVPRYRSQGDPHLMLDMEESVIIGLVCHQSFGQNLGAWRRSGSLGEFETH